MQPDEVLKDPALEHRARDISAGLRCLVCQNQSIDDSDADLARDLRLLVRERLTAGDTDGQVRDFIVQRYGEFVCCGRPFAPQHLVTVADAGSGARPGAGLLVVLRRRRPAGSEGLDHTEREAAPRGSLHRDQRSRGRPRPTE